jgi:hypothetical protein
MLVVVIYGNSLWGVALNLLTGFSFVGLGILITSFTDKEGTATMVAVGDGPACAPLAQP